MSRCFSLFLLALLSLTTPSWATHIYVSGDQTGTWSADTVIVTAEVRVPPGQSLTILPGVEVLFSVYCKLIVDNGATLRAVGTAADSIRFDVLPPNVNWHGIRFLSASDSSRLEFCHLTHGSATGGGEDVKGGAIYCSGSSPIIKCCLIDNCDVSWFRECGGGGIYCGDNSSPAISLNIITANSISNGYGGGIWCEDGSNPIISGNTISENSAGYIFGIGYGGGIYCTNSNPTISGNTITENTAADGSGGGICCDNSSPTIVGNTINGNSVGWDGGGIYCASSSPVISGNTIRGNSGGGLYCTGAGSSPTLVNCILWDNIPQQINGTPTVTYSDIQDGYTGTGNIATWPAFVDTAQDDYRLQWGSPCIDSGDPNPIYNDPDNTRADMGAWYYDQSMPQRVLLTPYNQPIQIPAIGGNFQYAIQVTNIASTAISVLGWCNVTLPSGTIYGPVLGPLTISLGAGQTVSRLRTQAVPASAPAGLYHYNAYAMAAGDTSEDSFIFVKLGSDGWDLGAGGWTNTGEEFDVGARHAVPMSGSGATPTTLISPNPFNATTALSFKLQAASLVSLRVYDTAGRLVVTLVEGWREAGEYQVRFDGSELAAGVYLYRLQAGETTTSGKMVLLK